MQTVPVSATPKFAPLMATCTVKNLRREVRVAAASASGLGLVGERLGAVELRAEEVADLGAVLVDRRDQDVRRPLAGELDDQLGEVGLDRRDALRRERLVEADLVGRQRLDLDDLAWRRAPWRSRPPTIRLASAASRGPVDVPPAPLTGSPAATR